MPLLVIERQVIIQNFFPYSLEIMYAAFFVSGFVMLYGFYRKLTAYGFSPSQFLSMIVSSPYQKVKRFLVYALGHRKILKEKEGGIMHAALFYGFIFLFIYTSLIFVQTDILSLFSTYNFMTGDFYLTLEFLGEIFGIAYIIGILIALYRRYVKRPEKLESALEDVFVLGMLVWIGASGFVIEALRLAIDPVSYGPISFLGYSLSLFINHFGDLSFLYEFFWFAHMLSVMVLIGATPYTKLSHVILSSLNIAVAPVKPIGKLETPFNLMTMMQEQNFNVKEPARRAKDLEPFEIFMADSCTNCGRCQEVCPAYASGRELTPRLLVRDIARDALRNEERSVFESGAITEQELWSCTMCNACVFVCPVMIDQVRFVVDFRRTLVNDSRIDGSRKQFLENIASSNNPYGLPQSERQRWIRDLNVKTMQEKGGAEYLYWIGCNGSYDSRGIRIASSVIKILSKAGVDFAVLGSEEYCTGEPVRRIGEEGRFQELVMKNIETFRKYNVKKIIVHCPHCYNTFKNEYKEFGLDAEIIHHSEIILDLIRSGRIKLKENNIKVTYHDPCNLGRINGIFEEPRGVINSLKGLELVEMKRARYSSFCCGGGGANMWYQVNERKKISVIRAEEAMSTEAKALVSSCPYCTVMFEDAMNSLGNKMEVKDIAEIVSESMV